MSSPIDNNSDLSFLFINNEEIGQLAEELGVGQLSLLQTDMLYKSTVESKATINADSDSPQLPPADPEALAVSQQQMAKLHKMKSTLVEQKMSGLLASLPPDLQAAYQLGMQEASRDQQIQGAKIQSQQQIEAMASLGLESIADSSSYDYSTLSFPPPGKIEATDPFEKQQAQYAANQIYTAGHQVQMLKAESSSDSLSAFLASISKAITELQEYLGTVQNADLKGSLGQSTEAGGDRAQIDAAKREEAKESSNPLGALGGLGDLIMSPIQAILKIIPGLGSLFGKGEGSLGSMFGGLMGTDIPILSDLLKGISDMTSGIPLVGDITKLMEENPTAALIAGIVGLCAMGPAIVMGPFAIVAGLGAAALVFGGLMLLSGKEEDIPLLGDIMSLVDTSSPTTQKTEKKSAETGEGAGAQKKPNREDRGVKGGLMDGVMAMSGIGTIQSLLGKGSSESSESSSDSSGLFGGGIGDLLSLTGIGMIGKLTGSNTLSSLFPSACFMSPITMLFSGDAGKTPILEDAVGTATTDVQSAGQSAALSDLYGATVKQIAEDEGVSAQNAELIGQIQKLIAMLVQLKAAIQNGGSTISTAEITEVVKNLSAEGVGGDSFKEAVAAGERGDLQTMIEFLSGGFNEVGVDIDKVINNYQQSSADFLQKGNLQEYKDYFLGSFAV